MAGRSVSMEDLLDLAAHKNNIASRVVEVTDLLERVIIKSCGLVKKRANLPVKCW